MRIADVTSTYTISTRLQNIKSQEAKLTEQLLSGKTVNSLQDNASLANTLLVSQADRERLVQLNSNSALANNTAQAGIDALTHIGDVNKLALSIAESVAEDGTSAASRNIDSLIEDVLATANTKYNGEYIFAGGSSGSSTAPFSYDSASGQYVYNGSGTARSYEVSDGASVSPYNTDSGNQAILDTLNSLVALRDAIQSGDSDDLSVATDALENANDAIVDASADLGMVQFRLGVLDSRNAAKYSVLDTADDNATKADENETTVKLLAAQNAYSAALQSAAKILDMSLLDYI